MRIPRILLAAAVVATAARAQQPSLVCPPVAAAPGRGCEAFHYHVAMFRPDTKQFTEIAAGNRFATQSACEHARDEAMKRNLALVNYWKQQKGDQRYEVDRFGPCHCEVPLDDAQRIAQLRTAEEIRQRVRERLIDEKVPSDSEIVRSLWTAPAPAPLIGGAKLVAPPAVTAIVVPVIAPEDLKATRAIDSGKPAVASLDLPLVDPAPPEPPAAVANGGTPATPAPAAASAATPAGGDGGANASNAAPPAAASAAPPAPTPAMAEVTVTPERVPEPPAQTEPVPVVEATTEELASAQEAADSFITYETERITNVINASNALADENVRARIFEACTQRLALLSNLRLLIEGAGTRSRLAAFARNAREEGERLVFVKKLFGSDIAPHWAPADAADVIVDVPAAIAAEPERVLRDTSGHASDDDKRRALFVVLSRMQPTEEQRLWLTTVADRLLQ